MENTAALKIGFIGYGNMSGAIAKGLLQAGTVCGSQIYACGRDFEKLQKRAAVDGIHACRHA